MNIKYSDDSVRFFICGDVINLSNRCSFIGQKLSNIIKKADFSVANLEGVELQEEFGIPPSPAQSSGTISYLSKVGFNMMLLANNHITDYGPNQLRYTISQLKKNGLSYLGAGFSWEETYSPLIVQIKQFKFGFFNICEAQVGHMTSNHQSYGYAWMSYDGLLDDIRKLASLVDRVVVFVHAGLEHYNLPLPEIRSFYKRMCDAGANAVIGSHPHIAQGVEFYKGSFIAYSLGNFFFPHPDGIYKEESKAFSLMLDFSNGNQIDVNIIHHLQKDGIVELVYDSANQHNVAELCELLGEEYEAKANEMCLNAYNKLCRRLLVQSLCGENDDSGFIEYIKDVIRKTLFRKKYVTSTKSYRDKQLLRLFENESYRFTIIRALKQICI